MDVKGVVDRGKGLLYGNSEEDWASSVKVCVCPSVFKKANSGWVGANKYHVLVEWVSECVTYSEQEVREKMIERWEIKSEWSEKIEREDVGLKTRANGSDRKICIHIHTNEDTHEDQYLFFRWMHMNTGLCHITVLEQKSCTQIGTVYPAVIITLLRNPLSCFHEMAKWPHMY